MLANEASRAAAFASQADRSRALAAGHVEQAIAVAKQVAEMRVAVTQALAGISIPHRWVGTRLELKAPDGEWIAGPDLAGQGNVDGPEASVIGNLAMFSGNTGQGIADSGVSVAGIIEGVLEDVAEDLAGKIDVSSRGISGGVASLDGDGKIPAGQLPALALTDVFEVGSQAAMLALTAQRGDIAIRTDLNKTFALAADAPGTLANWKELRTPTDVVLAVAGLTGPITANQLKTALALAAADITDASANGRDLIKAANYSAMFGLLKQAASTAATGVVKLSTEAEMVAGASTTAVPTVKQVVDKIATASLPKTVTSTLTAPFALATTGAWTDTGLTVTITPSSVSSRIALLAALSGSHSSSTPSNVMFRLVRGSAPVGVGDAAGNRAQASAAAIGNGDNYDAFSSNIAFVDTPATSGQVTYSVQMLVRTATGYLNRSRNDADTALYHRSVSTLTAIEVSA